MKELQKLINRRREIQNRLQAIADLAAGENMRELTESEKDEVKALERELSINGIQIQALNSPEMVTTRDREASIREWLSGISKNGKREGIMQRSMTTATQNIDANFPVTIEDIQKPLEEGLIISKLGIKIQTGLAGKHVIPGIAAGCEATVEGELDSASDTDLTWDKLTPNPKRLCVVIPLSNQLINQSNGNLYNIVAEQMGQGIARTLNHRMFTTKQSITNLVGPFKACAAEAGSALSALNTVAKRKACKKLLFAGSLPTYKELVALKGIAAVKGCEYLSPAYVMDEFTKSELESTPREAGDSKMIIEDGKINGIPVLCTNYINEGTNKNYVGFAFFGYEAMNQFGNTRITAEVNGRKDCIELTINADWAIDELKSAASVIGLCAGGGSTSGSGE